MRLQSLETRWKFHVSAFKITTELSFSVIHFFFCDLFSVSDLLIDNLRCVTKKPRPNGLILFKFRFLSTLAQQKLWFIRFTIWSDKGNKKKKKQTLFFHRKGSKKTKSKNISESHWMSNYAGDFFGSRIFNYSRQPGTKSRHQNVSLFIFFLDAIERNLSPL